MGKVERGFLSNEGGVEVEEATVFCPGVKHLQRQGVSTTYIRCPIHAV